MYHKLSEGSVEPATATVVPLYFGVDIFPRFTVKTCRAKLGASMSLMSTRFGARASGARVLQSENSGCYGLSKAVHGRHEAL